MKKPKWTVVFLAVAAASLSLLYYGIIPGVLGPYDPKEPPALILEVSVAFMVGCFLIVTIVSFATEQSVYITSIYFVIMLTTYIFAFAGCYKELGLSTLICKNSLCTTTVIHNGAASVYFAIITLTTVGYGDYTPTDASRWFAAGEAISGYFFIALVIAFVVDALRPSKRNVRNN